MDIHWCVCMLMCLFVLLNLDGHGKTPQHPKQFHSGSQGSQLTRTYTVSSSRVALNRKPCTLNTWRYTLVPQTRSPPNTINPKP